MKNMKLGRMMLFGMFGVAIILGGCSWFSSEKLTAESVLPGNVKLVYGVDFNQEKREALQDLLARLPEDPRENVVAEFENLVLDALEDLGINAEYEDIEQILGGDFRVILALGEGFSFADLENQQLDEEDVEMYISATSTEMGKIREFLDDVPGVTKSERGDFDVWIKAEDSHFYAAVLNDLIFATNTEESLQAGITRLENGGSSKTYFGQEDADEIAGYFLDFDELNTFFKTLGTGGDFFANWLLYSDMIGGYGITSDSIFATAEHDLSGEVPEEIVTKLGNEVSFVESVPGDNMLFYLEKENLYLDLDLIFSLVFLSTGEDIWQVLSSSLGMRARDFEELFSTPYALSLSSSGNFASSAFYLRINENNKEMAEDFLGQMDQFFDGMIFGFNEAIEADYGEGMEPMKKEIMAVNGQALRRLYIDWEQMPVEVSLQYGAIIGGNVNDLKLEIYYGKIDEDTIVIAFYPEFTDEFGQNVLSKNEDYKKAVAGLKGDYGVSVVYVNFSNLLTFVNNSLELFSRAGITEAEIREAKDVLVLFEPLDYFIRSAQKDGDKVYKRMLLQLKKQVAEE